MMFSGKNQFVTISSEPDNAIVYLNGESVGVTPITLPIRKGKNQIIAVEKKGYKRREIPLSTTFDPITLLGTSTYSTPLTTDFVAGTAYEFSPNSYYFDLKKKDQNSTEKVVSQAQDVEIN
jgi:hypothetical protein